jgi:hypothetical protein
MSPQRGPLPYGGAGRDHQDELGIGGGEAVAVNEGRSEHAEIAGLLVPQHLFLPGEVRDQPRGPRIASRRRSLLRTPGALGLDPGTPAARARRCADSSSFVRARAGLEGGPASRGRWLVQRGGAWIHTRDGATRPAGSPIACFKLRRRPGRTAERSSSTGPSAGWPAPVNEAVRRQTAARVPTETASAPQAKARHRAQRQWG